MWAAFIGRGIVHPADEMNGRNAPSHPELLDWLAQDFASHQYATRRVVRGIVLSRVYALGVADAAPETFAGALERPLSAEQIARSWSIAAGLPPNDDALRRAVFRHADVLPKDYNATFQQAQFLSTPALAGILPRGRQRGGTHRRLPDARARSGSISRRMAACQTPRKPRKRRLCWMNARPRRRTHLLWALMTSAEFLTTP